MSTVEFEEHFHIHGVTPQQCFDYLADLDNAGEWNTFVKSAHSDDPAGVGRVIHAKVQFLIPLPFEVKAEVIEYEEGHHYTIQSKVPFTSELGGRFVKDDDGTRFTYFFRMHPTKFFPVPKIVLKKAIQGQFDKDGKLIKHCFERLRA